jgi:hypothetical protein
MMKFEARRRKELRIRLQRAEMRNEREEVERRETKEIRDQFEIDKILILILLLKGTHSLKFFILNLITGFFNHFSAFHVGNGFFASVTAFRVRNGVSRS